jgi:hypothetical protein
MRGGHNKKSVDEHIRDGTYRADRYGHLTLNDAETLMKMKYALYKKFQKIDKALEDKGVDVVSRDTVNYYINVIKTFDAITKSPVKKEDAPKDGDGKKEL